MLDWLDKIPPHKLQSQLYLNEKKNKTEDQWVPPNYCKQGTMIEKWNTRKENTCYKERSLRSLLTSLQEMERESEEEQERIRHKKRPLVFGATPLLTDKLANSEEYLLRILPSHLIEQKDFLKKRSSSSTELKP